MSNDNWYIDDGGDKIWFSDPSDRQNTWHRLDGPAVVSRKGTLEWWVNDMRHRLDGPAIEAYNGDKIWYINGVRYYYFKDFQEAGGISDSDMMVLRLKYGEITI